MDGRVMVDEGQKNSVAKMCCLSGNDSQKTADPGCENAAG